MVLMNDNSKVKLFTNHTERNKKQLLNPRKQAKLIKEEKGRQLIGRGIG